MTTNPSVGIVIVAYQTREPVRACLGSLRASGGAAVGRVVVVDNGSTDDTASMVRDEFPEVELVDAGGNLGFAGGCNLGATRVDEDLILFLNPDTTVPAGAIDALVNAHVRHPRAGQIGGRTFDDDGVLDPSSCWGAPTLWSTICFATGLSAVAAGHPRLDPESLGGWARDSEREVGVVTGCLLLMPRHVFEEVGGFDETYFLYAEDIDLSMRVRRAGYTTMVTPDASITHSVGGASSSSVERSVLVLKGRMTLYRLRFGRLLGLVLRLLYLVGVMVRAALPARATGSGAGRKAPWRALLFRVRDWFPGYR